MCQPAPLKTACLSQPFFAKFEQALANGGNTFYVTPRDAASAFDVRLLLSWLERRFVAPEVGGSTPLNRTIPLSQ